MSWSYDTPSAPNQGQNLLLGTCKHLYLTRDGQIHYQQKAIDPRLPGTKTLLSRLLAMDVATNVFYAELHPAEPAPNLVAFLARAWSIKPDHLMRGVPSMVNIGKAIRSSESMVDSLLTLEQRLGFRIGELPSGFAAGAAQVRQFDAKVEEFRFNWETGMPLDIRAIQSGSAILSDACYGGKFWARGTWDGVQGLSAYDLQLLSAMLENVPWRDGPWRIVMHGVPRS